MERSRSKTDPFGPLRQRQGHSARRDVSAAAFIVRLLNGRGPSAVLGGVVPIVVASVNRHARRARAHVVGEGLKGVGPLRADRDAAPAIVLPARMLRVGTARLHVAPYHVVARPAGTVLQAACADGGARSGTAAAGRVARSKVARPGDGGATARALAAPAARPAAVILDAFAHGENAEGLGDQRMQVDALSFHRARVAGTTDSRKAAA